MIDIYTSLKYFKPNEIIVDNESFFNNLRVSDLTKESLSIMKSIDGAILLDAKTGKIETPFGITSITDLSTGCKTVLNTLYNAQHPEVFPTVKAINATECGNNAIEILFDVVERNDINIVIVLEHDNNLYKCNNREYRINNKDIVNNLSFLLAYKEI